VPTEVEEFVARYKLESVGIKIDELNSQQRKYMSGWEQGTYDDGSPASPEGRTRASLRRSSVV
jgi:hypothetical protein